MRLAIWLLSAFAVIMTSMSVGWYVFWSRVVQDLEKSNFEEKTDEHLELGRQERSEKPKTAG